MQNEQLRVFSHNGDALELRPGARGEARGGQMAGADGLSGGMPSSS